MYEIPTDKRLAELFLVRTCQIFLKPVLLDLILGSGTSTMRFKRQCHVRKFFFFLFIMHALP